MTIASQTSRISYTGDGGTTAFSVPFYFQANADIVVSVQDLSGNVTTELLGTDYTLTGASVSSGGTCTFTIAPTTGYIIAITRVPQITQTTSYNNNDPFPAKSHELALDKATTVDQYLKSLVDRAILVAPTDTPPMSTLPPASVRALKNLSFDALGNPSASTPVTGTAVSAAMIPVVSASTLAIARGLLGIADAVTTRTALKAIDTTKTTAAYLTEAGREGEFVFRSGNYAARVTADTQEGIYIKADAISTTVGAWVRVFTGSLFVSWFGVKGDGSTDDTTTLQAAITAGSVVIPPATGNYKLTGDIQIPSNRHIWLQNGATIVNTGGRFTAHLPGGGNVHFQIDGDISFVATATKPQLGDWPANGGGLWPERGLIEMGGSAASPGSGFKVTGTGYVYGDTAWTGVPIINPANFPVQLNMKGIAFFNCSDVLCQGMEVSNVYGECIYFWSAVGSSNIKFLNNNVHHVQFNGLNVNTFLTHDGVLISDNRVSLSGQGIELSAGVCVNNHIETTGVGITTGAGGGFDTLRIANNTVINADGYGIQMEFDPTGVPKQVMAVTGNMIYSPGKTGIIATKIDGFIIKGNIIYNHARLSAGSAISTGATATSGHIEGNVIRSPGAFTAGNVVDAGGNTIGTNPVF